MSRWYLEVHDNVRAGCTMLELQPHQSETLALALTEAIFYVNRKTALVIS